MPMPTSKDSKPEMIADRETAFGPIPETANASQVHRIALVANAVNETATAVAALDDLRKIVLDGYNAGTLTGDELAAWLRDVERCASTAANVVAGDADDAANSLAKLIALDAGDRDGVVSDEVCDFANVVLAAYDERENIELVLSEKKTRKSSADAVWFIHDHNEHRNVNVKPLGASMVTTRMATYLEDNYHIGADSSNTVRRAIMKMVRDGQPSASGEFECSDGSKVRLQVTNSDLMGRGSADGAPAVQSVPEPEQVTA